MTRSACGDSEMRADLPATLQAAEQFFIEFRRLNQAFLDRWNSFAAELLVREALTNAVMHGCHADPTKQVRCVVRLHLGNRRLLIAVKDDGKGFNWHAAWRNPAAACDSSGRGIAMLRTFASRVRYSTRGNLVAMIRRF